MTDDPIQTVTADDLARLAADAKTAPRLRSHRNLHAAHDEPVQRLLISADPDTYIQPHRHPHLPWEMIILLAGAMDVLLFSEDGRLTRRVELRADGDRMIQYPGSQYHGAVAWTPGATVLEIKQGPYVPETAKELPPWAPAEDSADGPAFRDRMRGLAVGDAA